MLQNKNLTFDLFIPKNSKKLQWRLWEFFLKFKLS